MLGAGNDYNGIELFEATNFAQHLNDMTIPSGNAPVRYMIRVFCERPLKAKDLFSVSGELQFLSVSVSTADPQPRIAHFPETDIPARLDRSPAPWNFAGFGQQYCERCS